MVKKLISVLLLLHAPSLTVSSVPNKNAKYVPKGIFSMALEHVWVPLMAALHLYNSA